LREDYNKRKEQK